MFLPYKVDVPMARIPWANWVLIAATSVVSIGVLLQTLHNTHRRVQWQVSPETIKKLQELEEKGKHAEAEKLVREWGLDRFDEPGFAGALDPQHFALTQLITYQFVHGDLIHLIGNMFFLFCFGNAVNAKLGHLGFVASYLFLGVIGGLGWLALGNGQPMVGASGAIMGIIGVFFVLFPRNDVTVLYGMWGGGGSFELASFWLILLYMVGDLVGLLRADQGVAYVTHLAGSLCGAGLGLTLVMTGILKSTPYEQNVLEALGLMSDAGPTSKRKRKKKRPITS